MKKISVIVPVYNTGKYLTKCLESLKSQSLSDIEIIVVDDGSDDESPSICDTFLEDERFFVFHNLNHGLSYSRNFGIEKATGEFLMFVDSDDWVDKDICKILYEAAIQNNVNYVMCGHFNESSISSQAKLLVDEDTLLKGENYERNILIHTVGLIDEQLKNPGNLDKLTPVWARLYRSDIIKSNNIKFTDTKLIPSEALPFNINYSLQCDSAFCIANPLYHYRRNNISSVTKAFKSDFSIKWHHWDKYCKQQYLNKYSEKINRAIYSRLCCSVIPLGGNALKLSSYDLIRKECKSYLESDMIRDAFDNFNYSQCPPHWKLFFTAAKSRWIDVFILMSWCMRKILNMRRR